MDWYQMWFGRPNPNPARRAARRDYLNDGEIGEGREGRRVRAASTVGEFLRQGSPLVPVVTGATGRRMRSRHAYDQSDLPEELRQPAPWPAHTIENARIVEAVETPGRQGPPDPFEAEAGEPDAEVWRDPETGEPAPARGLAPGYAEDQPRFDPDAEWRSAWERVRRRNPTAASLLSILYETRAMRDQITGRASPSKGPSKG